MYIAVIYTKGPAWTSREAAHEMIQAHIAYQHKNADLGKLMMGGPFVGEVGGMGIFEVESKAEAEAIVAKDPAVAGGIYNVELHEWRIAGRGRE